MASISAFPVFPLRCFSGNSHFRIAVLISRRVSAVGWVTHCAGQALREPMFCLSKAKALGTEKMQTKQSSCSAQNACQAKHMKSREEGEPGQILKLQCDAVFKIKGGGKPGVTRSLMMVRYLIKTGELIIDTIEKWKQLREAKDKERTTQVAVSSAS
ncbi:hypothetical protein F2Q70_00008004 [Brassica cretica]|uniref:Uncharacterized protein n=1 Tax=Brassica cretica TaxID=69181 RepID=A0A8S9M2Z5_BRACR|nr:hypothetical protein F2Q68_00001032 [Brassica cretica]KAF2611726.1 hypothetical protein F2Q70_00008004 [Brassica cretica]